MFLWHYFVTDLVVVHCSRCSSLQEASVLLEQMRFFDSWVYGIAHGLLMGLREHVWVEAQRLFDEIARMDYATGAAFYNALTDVLWHFGQVCFVFADFSFSLRGSLGSFKTSIGLLS